MYNEWLKYKQKKEKKFMSEIDYEVLSNKLGKILQILDVEIFKILRLNQPYGIQQGLSLKMLIYIFF